MDIADMANMADVQAGLLKLIGLRVDLITPDRAEVSITVTPDLFQPAGLVHGGIYCTIVETAASIGAAVWLGQRGQVVGVANHTDFIRAVREGELKAVATPIHRGRSQQLWLVEIHDEQKRLVARGEVRLQNLEPR